MSKSPLSINLLQEERNDTVEKVINWTLGIGRALIIVTEIIAFVAFLYRFTLDQQLVDLHSDIDKKQKIIESFKEKEPVYRNLQERLAIISNYSNLSSLRNKNYHDIYELAPDDITFNYLSMHNDDMSMQINVTSVASFGSYIEEIKNNPNVIRLSIDKIEAKTSDAKIIVGISIGLKPTQNNYAINTK